MKIIFLSNVGGRAAVMSRGECAGFIIQYGDTQIHVDPGPAALYKTVKLGLDPKKTDIVCVSHWHFDHSAGLFEILESMSLGGTRKRGVLVGSKSLMEKRIVPEFLLDYIEKYYFVSESDKVITDSVTIEATKTIHSDTEGVGFIFHFPEISIGYTGDTENFDALKDIFSDVDVLILNVLRPSDQHYDYHLSVDDVKEILASIKPQLAILTHFGLKMLKENPLDQAREVTRVTGVRTIAAEEGMVIRLKE